MKRSQFCKMVPGIACTCALGLGAEALSKGAISADSAFQENKSETPCNEKMEFTHKWLKRFFDIVDQQIDEETRTKLMQSNGTACAKGAYGELPDSKPASVDDIDKAIASWQERIGKENIYRKDNTVFFNYAGNPKGLKISDGFCLCPMIENGPATLSATYCQCSVGYVSYMFQRFITFRPVKVELIESLRSGGKGCRFKITV